MSRHRGRAVAFGGLMGALAVATLLTVLINTGGTALVRIDDAVLAVARDRAASAGWPVSVAHVVGLITAPFWPGILVAAVAALLWRRGFVAAAAMLALSGVLGIAAASGAKVLVGRPRPAPLADVPLPASAAFPSGHAAAGIYLVLALGLVLWRLGRTHHLRMLSAAGGLLVLVGPFIGVSRLILGVHWPSDVVAGWAFGSAALCTAALLLWDRLADQWGGSPPPSGDVP